MKFEEYFSFEAIVGDLVKWRIAGKDVGGTLPPRKMWSRAGAKKRKGVAPDVVRRQAIWRTVRRACGDVFGFAAGTAAPHAGGPQFIAAVGERGAGGGMAVATSCDPPGERGAGGGMAVATSCDPPGELGNSEWRRKLLALVDEVQGAVFSGKVAFEAPKMYKIPKGREGGVMQYREVASFERLADRVILSRMTAYVRDRLEPLLGSRCYSFRNDRAVNHQLAVKHLQDFRERFPAGCLFVAECDIQKFFDSISHEVVRRRWRDVGFEDAAGKVLEAYLGVYAVGEVVAQQRDPPGGMRRGLPQGGSFSTVLANLVLAEADRAVQDVDDGRLFYARYCDDVVFVHPDEAVCRRAMDAYAAALAKLDLPMHEVRPFVYKPADGSSTEYYSIKSKGPFRWREAEKGEADCAPWVSFLGSQVRYDGETRIRRESIEKHIRSLGRETAKAVREIEAQDEKRRSRGDRPPVAAREDARPPVAEWFARFRNRLIAKGVGYVTAKVRDCDMCWAGAFPNVTDCAETKMQMRWLDRVREGMLAKVWEMVRSQQAATLPLRRLRGDRPTGGFGASRTPRPTRRYKGRPFSYYGYLEKAVRPTNMARRRVKTHALTYSEL